MPRLASKSTSSEGLKSLVRFVIVSPGGSCEGACEYVRLKISSTVDDGSSFSPIPHPRAVYKTLQIEGTLLMVYVISLFLSLCKAVRTLA